MPSPTSLLTAAEAIRQSAADLAAGSQAQRAVGAGAACGRADPRVAVVATMATEELHTERATTAQGVRISHLSTMSYMK